MSPPHLPYLSPTSPPHLPPQVVLEQLNPSTKLPVLRMATWTLASICGAGGGGPGRSWPMIAPAALTILPHLLGSEDEARPTQTPITLTMTLALALTLTPTLTATLTFTLTPSLALLRSCSRRAAARSRRWARRAAPPPRWTPTTSRA